MKKLYKDLKDNNIELIETKLPKKNLKGLCVDNMIFLNVNIQSATMKKCVLAEELGHYHTSVGNILDMSKSESRKQEIQARDWAVKHLISLDSIISALNDGIDNRFDLAEYLDVTEDFLDGALEYFKRKYGLYAIHKGYKVIFNPCLKAIKIK